MLKFIYDVNALFIPIFRSNFYFGPCISILPLLVPNPINACYFSPLISVTQLTEKTDIANGVHC